jgi:transcription initiation factor IIE alpha subunit
MRYALDKDGKRISADEAIVRHEKQGTCPDCREPVKAFECRKIASHWEHGEGKKNCFFRVYLVA